MRPALLPTKVLKVEGVVELSPSVSVGKGVSLVLTFIYHRGPRPKSVKHKSQELKLFIITIRLPLSNER